MKNRLAELILEQIEAVLEREPSEDALFDLLRIASPKISRESLTDEKLYKKLILQIDVNKKSSLYERADKVVKSLDVFYKECLQDSKQTCTSKTKNETITSGTSNATASRKRSLSDDERTEERKKKKGKIDSSSAKKFPLNYDILLRWPHLHMENLQPFHRTFTPKEHLEANIAFQCINARGSIIHGRETSIHYNAEGDDQIKTTRKIFEKHGGYDSLATVESIKEELMKRGPVVSTSFTLTSSFLASDPSRKVTFDEKFKDQVYPVLIVGWENTVVGEVWKICTTSTRGECKTHQVAFGQMNIDTDCIAPKETFESWAWQEGPFFDTEISEDYSSWGFLKLKLRLKISADELGELSTVVGGDFVLAAISKKTFTLRNLQKPAQSRTCFIRKIAFHTGDQWNVTVKFC